LSGGDAQEDHAREHGRALRSNIGHEMDSFIKMRSGDCEMRQAEVLGVLSKRLLKFSFKNCWFALNKLLDGLGKQKLSSASAEIGVKPDGGIGARTRRALKGLRLTISLPTREARGSHQPARPMLWGKILPIFVSISFKEDRTCVPSAF